MMQQTTSRFSKAQSSANCLPKPQNLKPKSLGKRIGYVAVQKISGFRVSTMFLATLRDKVMNCVSPEVFSLTQKYYLLVFFYFTSQLIAQYNQN